MILTLIVLLSVIFYSVCVFLTTYLYCEKNIEPGFWSLLFLLIPPLNVFTAFFGFKSLIHKIGFKGIFINPFTNFIKQVAVEEKPKYRI